MKKQKKNMRSMLLGIMMSGLTVIVLVAGVRLWGIYGAYEAGKQEYEHIAEEAAVGKSVSREPGGDLKKRKGIDFATLEKMNPDIVGWISFDEGLQIEYPLVQGKDNETYLETTFEGRKNAAGCLFLDYRNQKDFGDSHTLIYGHNMKDGSMFGKLRNYRDSNFLKEHPTFSIETPDGIKRIYEIFEVRVVDCAEEVQESVSMAPDNAVTLFTCTNRTAEERLLVQGMLKETIVME